MEVTIGTATGITQGLKQTTTPSVIHRSEFLVRSQEELELALRQHAVLSTLLQVAPEEQTEFLVKPFYDDEEFGEDDFYDAPDMEANIENEEGRSDSLGENDVSEGFEQFVLRRLESDFYFDSPEDLKIITIIDGLLKVWDGHGELPDDLPLAVRNWAEEAAREFFRSRTALSLDDDKAHEPDIIIFRTKGDITYEIGAGFFDQINLSVLKNARETIRIGTYDIPLAQLPGLIADRKKGLSIIAEFLLEKQKAFFEANTLQQAILSMASISSNEFIKYVLKEYSQLKDKSWKSRLIKSKWVKVPFSQELLPLGFFFDEHIGRLAALKTAMDIHLASRTDTVFVSTDQAALLKAIRQEDYSPKSIKSTLFKKLKPMFPAKNWERIGMSGQAGRAGLKKMSGDTLKILIIKTAQKLGHSINIDDNSVAKLRSWAEQQEASSNLKKSQK